MPVKRKGGGGREFQWIRWIRSLESRPASPAFPLSIGDDAAIWTPGKGLSVVLSVDAQVEGVHFRRDWLTLREIGERAVTSSVSDLAAMAARPAAILVSIVLSPETSDAQFRQLHGGLHRSARSYGIRIIGGNLSSGPLSIAVTAVGEGRASELVRRSGARAGDDIWVTGHPGLARLGLRTLALGSARTHSGLTVADRVLLKRAIAAFVSPRARLKESQAISKALLPTAMIDLSDGLGSDLAHILEESTTASGQSLGAEVWEEPLSGEESFDRVARALGETGVGTALEGGEDYELCFTTKPGAHLEQKVGELSRRLKLRITKIGRIVARRGLRLVDSRGKIRKVVKRGWDHFHGGRVGP